MNSLSGKLEFPSQKTRSSKRQRQPQQASVKETPDQVEGMKLISDSGCVAKAISTDAITEQDNLVVEVEISPEKNQEISHMSAEMESGIQEIRQRMENFTQQVSGLLEEVKNIITETVNAFEERLVVLHQSQIENWEEEIRQLTILDHENEDRKVCLRSAQEELERVYAVSP